MTDLSIISTQDGSPTLLDSGTKEPMHNLQGAFSESLFIYLEALKKIPKTSSPSILSVGLGLAYNEMISIAYLGQQKITHFKITSYEKNPLLKTALENWCMDQNPHPPNDPLPTCYETILNLCAEQFNLNVTTLKESIREAIISKKWTFQGEINNKTIFNTKYNCIYYDAFSEKTNPLLWSEDHLKNFAQQVCEKDCVFSTYAAKGALNRVLREEKFVLEKRSGFGRKKESTLAIRA